MNELHRLVDKMLCDMALIVVRTVNVKVTRAPTSRHRGKRARRDAFYARQREARSLARGLAAAYADQVRTGTGFYTFRTPT